MIIVNKDGRPLTRIAFHVYFWVKDILQKQFLKETSHTTELKNI